MRYGPSKLGGLKLKMKNLGIHMNNQIVEMFEDGHAYPVDI